jgi:hypothetical protein
MEAIISLSSKTKAINYVHILLVWGFFVIKWQLRRNYRVESVKHLPLFVQWPYPPAHSYLRSPVHCGEGETTQPTVSPPAIAYSLTNSRSDCGRSRIKLTFQFFQSVPFTFLHHPFTKCLLLSPQLDNLTVTSSIRMRYFCYPCHILVQHCLRPILTQQTRK